MNEVLYSLKHAKVVIGCIFRGYLSDSFRDFGDVSLALTDHTLSWKDVNSALDCPQKGVLDIGLGKRRDFHRCSEGDEAIV